jgi:hypothetical protein
LFTIYNNIVAQPLHDTITIRLSNDVNFFLPWYLNHSQTTDTIYQRQDTLFIAFKYNVEFFENEVRDGENLAVPIINGFTITKKRLKEIC